MLSDMDKQILNSTIKKSTSRIAIFIDSTPYAVEIWMQSFCDMLHEIYIKNGQVVLAFLVRKKIVPSVKCSKQNIQYMIDNCRETSEIDLDLNLNFECELKSADQLDISEHGEDNQSVILRLDGEILEVFISGRLFDRINILHPLSKSEKRVGKNQRYYEDYKILIGDHSKSKLITQMNEYWEDRGVRILIGGKTEHFFQTTLFEWLNRFLYGGYPKIETRTNCGDKTDIDIYAFLLGCHYVVEIKWLGKNANGTEYKFNRFIEGIGQIDTYIKRDSSLTEACLVCYDGRPEEEYLKNSVFDRSLIPPKGDCMLIFLESESASRKGEKYAYRSKLES